MSVTNFDVTSHQKGYPITRPSVLTIRSDTYYVVACPCHSLINRLSLSNATTVGLGHDFREPGLKSVSFPEGCTGHAVQFSIFFYPRQSVI